MACPLVLMQLLILMDQLAMFKVCPTTTMDGNGFLVQHVDKKNKEESRKREFSIMNDLTTLLSPDVARNRNFSLASIRNKNKSALKDTWLNKIKKTSISNTIGGSQPLNRNESQTLTKDASSVSIHIFKSL